jgi:xanthine/uracil permease
MGVGAGVAALVAAAEARAATTAFATVVGAVMTSRASGLTLDSRVVVVVAGGVVFLMGMAAFLKQVKWCYLLFIGNLEGMLCLKGGNWNWKAE